MLTTFDKIIKFNSAADNFFKRKPTNIQTKLGYAINKIVESDIKSIIVEYQKQRGKLWYEHVGKKEIDLALTDKATGAVLSAPKGSDRAYMYDKNGLKALIEAEKEFDEVAEKFFEEYKLKEFNVEPHIASVLPDDLSDMDKEAFAGFVIVSAAE